MLASQSEVDEVIESLAENHPDCSVDQFQVEFKSIIGRVPSIKEKVVFQKAAAIVRKNAAYPQKLPIVPTAQILNGYTFSTFLGRGTVGEVYKCHKDGNDYAIKHIKESKNLDEMEQYFATPVIRARLNSSFLVKYIDKFRTPGNERTPNGELYVVMELCPKGDLRTRIENLKNLGTILSETNLMKITIQLLLGLALLHKNRFIHRDMKPENVFVDKEDNVKIGDFGCAKELDLVGGKTKTFIGTPEYESPQVLFIGRHVVVGCDAVRAGHAGTAV